MTTNDMTSKPVLITGVTGKQGGAVARALLAAGTPVRALVRDAQAPAARAVEALGASLITGDLNDPASLVPAATGVRAVFSVQIPDLDNLDSDAEQVRGRNLVKAALTAGVPQFVHTSVAGAGDHREVSGWKEGRWSAMDHYWESKAYIDEQVRSAGFESWTVLKPTTFMENLLGWSPLFGNWQEDGLVTALAPDTALALIAVADIGAAGAASLRDPERFSGRDIDLAGDLLTVGEMAGVLSNTLGREIQARSLSPAEALEQGIFPMIVTSYERFNEVGVPARPETARALGLPTTSFSTWARQHFTPST